MIRIVILGTGNVAKHLFDAFLTQKGIETIQVYGRKRSSLIYFEEQTNVTSDFSKIKKADLYIIAISDEAIAKVSKQLAHLKGLIVHTSGSVPMTALASETRRGVFYPLQTFSTNKKVHFREIPICLEAENELDYKLLNKVASAISDKAARIDSDQRKSVHIAAVFANNFTNHLYHTAQEVCNQNEIPFELLVPLIKETAAKIEYLSPFDAQTGPARRNDTGTIEKHMANLRSQNHKDLYSLLTKSIQSTYGKKL